MEKETTTNVFGITIVKCCASCANKMFTSNEKKRDCIFGEKNLPTSYLCKQWKMAKGLERAGKGNGRVRKPDWYRYLREFGHGRPIDDVTEEYEKKRGSKYLTK